MKKAIAGIVAIAGIAAAADAAVITYQVRPVGVTAWSSSINVNPGTEVEFRAIVRYDGPAQIIQTIQIPALDENGDPIYDEQGNPVTVPFTGPFNVRGIAGVNTQPTVSNWNTATDSLAAFNTTGVVANLNTQYGRKSFAGSVNLPVSSALRGHTNNVSGVSYLRIAQNNTTNWVGVGPTAGTSGANNFNGAGGVTTTQYPPSLAGAQFISNLTALEIQRFQITVGGAALRTLEISSSPLALSELDGLRRVQWYTDSGLLTPFDDNAITFNSALVNVVPTPGAIALLGMGGLLAARRRRA